MDGARWTFAYLGADFCVEVRGGAAHECGGGPLPPTQWLSQRGGEASAGLD